MAVCDRDGLKRLDLNEVLTADRLINFGRSAKRDFPRTGCGFTLAEREDETPNTESLNICHKCICRSPKKGESKGSDLFSSTGTESYEEDILQRVQKRMVLMVSRSRENSYWDASVRMVWTASTVRRGYTWLKRLTRSHVSLPLSDDGYSKVTAQSGKSEADQVPLRHRSETSDRHGTKLYQLAASSSLGSRRKEVRAEGPELRGVRSALWGESAGRSSAFSLELSWERPKHRVQISECLSGYHIDSSYRQPPAARIERILCACDNSYLDLRAKRSPEQHETLPCVGS
jgi:hypothetical protein